MVDHNDRSMDMGDFHNVHNMSSADVFNQTFTQDNSLSMSMMSEDLDSIRRFFHCLSKLNYPECKKLLQQNSGIYDQFSYEGFPPRDQVTMQFMRLLSDLLDFEVRYYQFTYFEDKNLMKGQYQKFQDLRLKLVDIHQQRNNQQNNEYQPIQNVFTGKLIQILSEIEYLIRLKNLMMFHYKDELLENKNDKNLTQEIKSKKNELDTGPKGVNTDSQKKALNKSQSSLNALSGYQQKYEWSREVSPLKEHFYLELTTLEALLKSKQAALRQDHITTLINVNTAKECFKQRNQEFYDKNLRDLHNTYNNLWKWILNLNLVLLSRNRLLLNSFITSMEQFVNRQSKGSQQELTQSKLDKIMIAKIQNLCQSSGGVKDFQTNTQIQCIQRVDVMMNLNECKAIMKLKDHYLLDQCLSEEQMQSRRFNYKDQVYINLFSCSNPQFKEALSLRLLFENLELFLQNPQNHVSLLRKHFHKITYQKVKYHFGQFDNGHYLLISTLIDEKVKQKEEDKFREVRENLHKSLQMERYYRGMNQWKHVNNCFS